MNDDRIYNKVVTTPQLLSSSFPLIWAETDKSPNPDSYTSVLSLLGRGPDRESRLSSLLSSKILQSTFPSVRDTLLPPTPCMVFLITRVEYWGLSTSTSVRFSGELELDLSTLEGRVTDGLSGLARVFIWSDKRLLGGNWSPLLLDMVSRLRRLSLSALSISLSLSRLFFCFLDIRVFEISSHAANDTLLLDTGEPWSPRIQLLLLTSDERANSWGLTTDTPSLSL